MKSRLNDAHWILTRPAAHRGLHGGAIPENSLAAFDAAARSGYPIELDVQMTADGKLAVFHDDNLQRMTGLSADIRETEYAEVKSLRLGGEHCIPDFSEALELVAGRVPLLIEIKTQKRAGIAEAVLKALEGYSGEFAIQSFDPRIMLEIKKLKPEVLRGLLGTAEKSGLGFKTDFAIKRLPLNFLVKPDFINYDLKFLPVSRLITGGLPLLCWTVRSKEDMARAEKYAKSFVFETVRP